ncbi:MAG: hypothetical protein PF637_13555 [Spirochaetes bacterium]|nr:hypothetical protein [Spirochaetota bacterium]
MCKRFLSFLFIIIFLFLVTSCGEDEKEDAIDLGPSTIDDYPKGEVDEAKAAILLDDVMSAVNSVEALAVADGKSSTRAKQTESISYTDPSGNLEVTGEASVDDSDGSFEVSMKMLFSDYLAGNGILLHGIVKMDYDGTISDTVYDLNYTYSGDYKVLYENQRYDISWDFKMTMSMDYAGEATTIDYTYTGSYTCNGETFQVEDLYGSYEY